MVEKMKQIKAYEVTELMRGPNHAPTSTRKIENVPLVSFQTGREFPEGAETLVDDVVAELRKRGYRAARIRRYPAESVPAAIEDLDATNGQVDDEAVLSVTPDRMVLSKHMTEEPTLEDMVAMLGGDYDVVIGEGFKFLPVPKFLVTSREQEVFTSRLPNVIGYVSDRQARATIPWFGPRDVEAIADKIEKDVIAPCVKDRATVFADGVMVRLPAEKEGAILTAVDEALDGFQEEEPPRSVRITIRKSEKSNLKSDPADAEDCSA